MVLGRFTWLAPIWEGWEGEVHPWCGASANCCPGSPSVTGAPDPRLPDRCVKSRLDRSLVDVVYLEAALIAVGLALTETRSSIRMLGQLRDNALLVFLPDLAPGDHPRRPMVRSRRRPRRRVGVVATRERIGPARRASFRSSLRRVLTSAIWGQAHRVAADAHRRPGRSRSSQAFAIGLRASSRPRGRVGRCAITAPATRGRADRHGPGQGARPGSVAAALARRRDRSPDRVLAAAVGCVRRRERGRGRRADRSARPERDDAGP